MTAPRPDLSHPSGTMSGMATGDDAGRRKARGAFFTPEPVARFLFDWAVRTPADDVLEPSCGEAVFLHQARPAHTGRLTGVEIHPTSARRAQRSLRGAGIKATVFARDFFRHNEFGAYDAVVGNPPYIRYQDFSGEARTRSRQAALRGGVALPALASSWAAFTVHAALQLRRGGRLALVLPAELLTVNYAAGVRQFLMDNFGAVGLVLFRERVFPGVLEEVVLLLAEDYRPGDTGADHMRLWQIRDVDGLGELAEARRWTPPGGGARWSGGLMSGAGQASFDEAVSGRFTPLQTWGETTLGMVTGSNRFFALSPQRVEALGLTDTDVVALSPPGSRHLRTLALTANTWRELGEAGAANYLFRPGAEPSAAARRYIRSGENLDVHHAYKCRVRSPWWRVPYLGPADLFLTYMNADTPRLTANRARAHHLNSVHGVYLRDGLRADGMDLLPLAVLNSVTLLGAETVGRAYGGGLLKLEPREADQLPVPSVQLVRSQAAALRRLRPTVTAKLRAGRLLEAVADVDEVLLADLDAAQLRAIRTDHADLTARRVARGRSARGN